MICTLCVYDGDSSPAEYQTFANFKDDVVIAEIALTVMTDYQDVWWWPVYEAGEDTKTFSTRGIESKTKTEALQRMLFQKKSTIAVLQAFIF